MSETRDQANADAQTALTAIQTAENTQFIANVDAQIQEAIAQGRFEVSATTSKNVDIQTVFEYYVNLGYMVWFPDYPTNLNVQPVELFGQYWTDYWQHILSLYPLKNPARIIVGWR
jgi:hypothetical protein